MQTPYRHELAYGFTTTRGSRLAVVIIAGVVGTPLCFVLGLLIGWIISVVSNTSGDITGVMVAIPLVLAVLLSGLFATGIVLALLKVTRTTAWLEGSRLTIRKLGSRTVDLAQATSVGIHPTQLRWRVPGRADMISELIVAGPFETMYLRLSTSDALPMPPQDIAALVSVLSATGTPGSADVIKYLRGH